MMMIIAGAAIIMSSSGDGVIAVIWIAIIIGVMLPTMMMARADDK